MATIEQQVIDMLQKRLSFNEQQRQAAFNRGDIAEVARLDADTADTQRLLDLVRPQPD